MAADSRNSNENYDHPFFKGILTPLWKWLPSKEKCSFRLLCKSLNKEIDMSYGCNLIIDDSQFELRNKPVPPISTVFITKLSPIYNISCLLTSPWMIQNIILNGNIDVTNFLRLVQYSNNLLTIEFLSNFNFLNNTNTIDIFLQECITLNSLKKLKIHTSTYTLSKNWPTVKMLLEKFRLPSLINFSIDGTFEEQDSSSYKTIWKFLCQNITLQHVGLNLRNEVVVNGPNGGFIKSNPGKNDELSVKMNLKTLLVGCDRPYYQITDELLKASSLLEMLEYGKPNAPWEFYNNILIKNKDNLKVIKIRNSSPPLNMSSLQNCINLKVLHLHQAQQSLGQEINITNLKELPQSIIDLELRNYSADSLDLLSLVKRLKKLRRINLETLSAPSNPETGVTASIVIVLLTRCRTLETLLVEEALSNNTCLEMLNSRIGGINMISGPNVIETFGVKNWLLAIAPNNEVPEEWNRKLRRIQQTPWIEWDIM